MQQTLSGCAFCDALPGSERGAAFTWGKDERISHPICVDCAVQARADPDDRDHHVCDSCGLVVDTLAAHAVSRGTRASRGNITPLCPL